MTDYLKQITFAISGAWTPPYSLPSAGNALAIGTNVAQDIKPAAFSNSQWGYSLFNAYGGGDFISEYSEGGAFAIASTGGHTANENIDCALFDFSDATWKLRANGNGLSAHPSPYQESEVNNDDYQEVIGTEVPAPAHLYGASANHIPSGLGAGTKGTFLRIMGYYPTTMATSTHRSLGVHAMDLNTGVWTRKTNDVASLMGAGTVPAIAYDSVLERWWMTHQAPHAASAISYLRASDWTIQTANYTWLEADPTSFSSYGAALFHPTTRALILIRNSAPLWAFDTASFGNPITLNTNTNVPSSMVNVRWTYCPTDECFYGRANASGQTLHKLAPPSSGDWHTAQWTFSSQTIGGATLPDFTNIGGNGESHWTCFFWVPAISCFAWVPGENHSVYLVKPA